jgi:haloalkane dehalogenase
MVSLKFFLSSGKFFTKRHVPGSAGLVDIKNGYTILHPEYTFKSHYFEIDDHRLHYIDEGQGPVIVAIHGNPTWSFYYRKVINHLRKYFRVIALDHIGCGLSDKPQKYSYTLNRHIENLTELLNSLHIQKCSLMVHDWGGAIGMGYAVRHPENIEKIVVLNTAAFRSQRIPFRIAVCRWPLVGEFLVRGLNGFAWPATFMAVSRPLDRLTKRHYLLPYDSWHNRIAIHRFVQDIPLDTSHPSYPVLLEVEKGLDFLRELKIPLLLLWGGKDFCFTREFFEEWKKRFPDAEAHMFDNLGHYVLEDGYEVIEPYLNSFFDIQIENSSK